MSAIGVGALAIALALLVAVPLAGAVTLCAEKAGGGERWMWREIDGRRCWYQGEHLLPKTELRWGHDAPDQTRGRGRTPPAAEGDEPRPVPYLLRTRVVPEGMGNLSNWIDGRGGPIDLMRGEELQGAGMLGGVLVVPPYYDRAARMFNELER